MKKSYNIIKFIKDFCFTIYLEAFLSIYPTITVYNILYNIVFWISIKNKNYQTSVNTHPYQDKDASQRTLHFDSLFCIREQFHVREVSRYRLWKWNPLRDRLFVSSRHRRYLRHLDLRRLRHRFRIHELKLLPLQECRIRSRLQNLQKHHHKCNFRFGGYSKKINMIFRFIISIFHNTGWTDENETAALSGTAKIFLKNTATTSIFVFLQIRTEESFEEHNP